jgi:hypothetical protein
VRLELLEEALQIIRHLFIGEQTHECSDNR